MTAGPGFVLDFDDFDGVDFLAEGDLDASFGDFFAEGCFFFVGAAFFLEGVRFFCADFVGDFFIILPRGTSSSSESNSRESPFEVAATICPRGMSSSESL